MSAALTPEQELAELIADQERDERWGHRASQRGVSLDYEFAEGGSFAEIVGYGTSGESATRKIRRPQRWTKRQIIGHIRAWVKQHGELPKYADWNKPDGRGIPSAASVVRRFGSWDAGMAAAGFEPRGVGGCDRQPGPPKRSPRVRKQKVTSRLSQADLAAAYVLYDRQGLSLPDLAGLLWERYGYASPKLCRDALYNGFRAEGFKIRGHREARLKLAAERRSEIASKAGEGAKRARARLTAQDRADIRALRGKMGQAELGRRYGVTASAISYIQRNPRRVGTSEAAG